jgi:septal ring factor EnvC (AmiA/AmiB activator)
MKKTFFSIAIIFLVLFSTASSAQTKAQLKQQREALEKEISEISSILASNRERKSSVLNEVDKLSQKIDTREKLVRVYDQEVNLLTNEINENSRNIDILRNKLKKLKKEYAQMIRQSYRSNTSQNRIMFLLSSESFYQAYKRIQYLKQYANYRRKQGKRIVERTEKLQELNEKLFAQREEKENLLARNKAAKEQLEKDQEAQEELIAQIRKKESVFERKIRKKQERIAQIDKEIDRIIKEAIAAEDKEKSSDKDDINLKLTPEAQLLADNFEKNKGKLPWPVDKGFVAVGFGTRRHPIVKSAKISSSGVRITTEENGIAKAVFDGKVTKVYLLPGGNNGVIIKHGNYFTNYYNLKEVFVNTGQDITTGDELGVIAIGNATQDTTLKFSIYRNLDNLNPQNWVYKM